MKLALIGFAAVVSIACSATRSASTVEPPPQQPAITQSPALASNSPVTGKSACLLKMSELAPIKGLKLGMIPDEVLALFPGSKDDAELRSSLSRPPSPFGNSSFVIHPSRYKNAAEFTEVSQISFSVLDGRVSNFTIGYNGPEWPHVDKFVAKFVEGTNLPTVDQWEAYAGSDNQMKTLTCANFSIRLFASGPGGNVTYVLMQDLEADKKLKERRKKAREQASPTPGQ